MKNFPFFIFKSKRLSACRSILVAIAFLVSNMLHAQIYEPDGVRMPGTWNNWENSTAMGGNFDLVKINSGVPRWQTTFQGSSNTTEEFKFTSTGYGEPWGNQWGGNQNIVADEIFSVSYGQNLANNQFGQTPGKWYTVVFEDNGYADTRAIFMETSAEPVTITAVSQNPLLVASADEVQISITLSAVPSPEELFYVRYTSDEWATSAIVPVALSSATGIATLPPAADGVKIEYYVLSTTVSAPSSDFDLVTIRMNNNDGQNYNYTVGETINCEGAIDLLTTDPAFPLESDDVVIYFNAEYGNGGLFNYEGDVYAHTGVITNLSTSGSDWKYVKTEWGQNTPETKLERLGDNLYSLAIPNIRSYYGVPSGEQILKLAFVFRGGEPTTGTTYPEHKNADGTDIFAEVYQAALNVKIMSPTDREPLASPDKVLAVCVEALQNQTLSLYLDNELLTTTNASSIAYPLVLQSYPSGNYWIKAVAGNGSEQARDSVNIYLRGPVEVADLPAGVKNGINYNSDNTVTLVLNDAAARKQFAFAIGEYSNWLPNDANYMKRTPDGKYFWVTLSGLTSGKEYAFQYFIDGELKLADPYTEKVLDPWNDKWIPEANYPGLKDYPFDRTTGPVSVFQTGQAPYNWQITSFTPPAVNATQSDLFIYELLLRDFTDEHTLAAAIGKLDYLKNLGVNAIELMPVAEFDGNESWGYAPNFFLAPDKYYGTKQNYKQFIDECHQRGIAVVLDIVANHAYGQCPMVNMYWDATTGKPSSTNPWFNPDPRHPYNIGYDFNHESTATRQFFKDVLSFWLTEYKVDGFRFDLSKGLTQTYTGDDVSAWSQYDQSRINILTDYYNHIKSVNSNACMILEHLSNNDEQTVLANTGMLLWSGMHDQYKQVEIGWPDNSDVSWAYHANRGWNYPNLVDYMENHDEERLMADALAYGNVSGDYDLKDTTDALHHMQMAAVLFMGIPGPKMVWQFGEMGYDYSILYNGGRTAAKPPRWDYWQQPRRQEVTRTFSAMATLRKSEAFRSGAFTSDLGGTGKRMWISHSSMNVAVSVNMGVTSLDMTPGFQHTGTWYDYFSGETVSISDVNQSFNFSPGAFRVFTDVQLPRPFSYVNVTVTDSLTGNAVAGASVAWSEGITMKTDASGKLTFTALPQPATMAVTAEGYKLWTKTLTITSNQELTVKLKQDSNFGTGEEIKHAVNLLPNPAHGKVSIEADDLYRIDFISLDGRIVMQHQMETLRETIPVTSLKPGIYLLRFTNRRGIFSARLMVE